MSPVQGAGGQLRPSTVGGQGRSRLCSNLPGPAGTMQNKPQAAGRQRCGHVSSGGQPRTGPWAGAPGLESVKTSLDPNPGTKQLYQLPKGQPVHPARQAPWHTPADPMPCLPCSLTPSYMSPPQPLPQLGGGFFPQVLDFSVLVLHMPGLGHTRPVSTALHSSSLGQLALLGSVRARSDGEAQPVPVPLFLTVARGARMAPRVDSSHKVPIVTSNRRRVS